MCLTPVGVQARETVPRHFRDRHLLDGHFLDGHFLDLLIHGTLFRLYNRMGHILDSLV
jgi:hypothetical protein